MRSAESENPSEEIGPVVRIGSDMLGYSSGPVRVFRRDSSKDSKDRKDDRDEREGESNKSRPTHKHRNTA